MKAVILAAGRGRRLEGHWDAPKGLYRLGSEPLILESIRAIRQAGVSEIVLVTGFRAELYRELLGHERDITLVENELFDTYGSLYSLYSARSSISRSCLIFDSDIFYEPRALDVLLSLPDDDAVLISGPHNAGDEVYVEVLAGAVRNITKDPAAASSAAGLSVGIAKLSAAFLNLMFEVAGDRVFSKAEYDSDGMLAAAQVRPLRACLIADLVWGEIDDKSQLDVAKRVTYPELRRRASARS